MNRTAGGRLALVSAGAPSPAGTGDAVLRALALACCALGALGLALPGRLAARPALRVLDVSASMGRAARGPAGAFQGGGERLLFADGVRWTARDDEAVDLPRGRSRLAQALTEAATRFPRGPRRVWLVSDGRDTEGGAIEAAALLAAKGVTLDVSAPDPVPADVALLTARVVAEGGGGATVVVARVESNTSGRARLSLRDEGGTGAVLEAREVALAAGVAQDVALRATTPPAGGLVDVVLTPLDGTPDDDPDNDRLALALPAGARRVVFLDPAEAAAAAAGRWGPLTDVLARPPAADEVDAADAIVVGDLAARRIGRAGVERLLAHAARGGAVLALGGPQSYGPGGWAGTALESMLPLQSPAGDAGETAVVLALDVSGSTGETPPGSITTSRRALLEAADTLWAALPARARVAVLPFRAAPFDAPLSPAWAAPADEDAKAALSAALRATPAEGGTDLPRAIAAAARLAASRAGAKRRLVLLATDGDPDHAPSTDAFAPARAALVEAGAELAAVVRGDAPAAGLLRDLAGSPSRVALIGAPAEFADALARVFHEAARGAEVERGPWTVAAAPGEEDDAASLPAAAPSRAHVLEAAPGARVTALMRRADGAAHPFAAVRALGAGVVAAVAWGPALEEGAAADAARRALGPFLARLAHRGDRGLEAFEEGSELVVRASEGRGALRVRRGDAGEANVLIEKAPGLYRGPSPLGALDGLFAETEPGTWRPLRGAARPPAEHRGAGVDAAALAALAHAGGGRRLGPGEAAGPSRSPATTPLSPALLSTAVVLLVAERARATLARGTAARGHASAREAA